MKTCGSTRALYWLAGYAHGREAKTLERLTEFAQAQGAYGESIVWMRRAMSAPASSVTEVSRGAFRGLALAQEGTGETDALKETLKEWAQVVGDDSATRWEYERLCCLFPPAEGGDMAPSEGSR